MAIAIRPPYTMRERWLAAYRDWRRGRRELEPGQTPAQLAMTMMGSFGKPFRPVFDPGLVAAVAPPWWPVVGKTCVAAYQPKGAASLAASYVNLANPGTYDAAPGVAPTLNAATGWGSDGTKWLDTGIIPAENGALLVRFSDGGESGGQCMVGALGPLAKYHALGSYWYGDAIYFGNGNGENAAAPKLLSGVLAFSGNKIYRNGISSHTISGSRVAGARSYYIFGLNDGDIHFSFVGNIQAIAIYSASLTDGEVAAVSAAMAAL